MRDLLLQLPSTRTFLLTGLGAGIVFVILAGVPAFRYDEAGQFTNDLLYFARFLFTCFLTVVSPFACVAIAVALTIRTSWGRRQESQARVAAFRSEPKRWRRATKAIAWAGTLMGVIAAFLAGDAALWHNPHLTISSDPIYLTMIMMSWFAAVGGLPILIAFTLETVFRLRQKHA